MGSFVVVTFAWYITFFLNIYPLKGKHYFCYNYTFYLLPILLSVQVATKAICNMQVRTGECPVILQVHWKGVNLPRQRSSRPLKTIKFEGIYSLFSAVKRFLYLRDFFYYFDRFFNLCLRDFLNNFFKDFWNRDLRDLCNL